MAQKKSPSRERQPVSPDAKRNAEFRKRILALQKKTERLSREVSDLLKGKSIDRCLVPDLDPVKAWEGGAKERVKALCAPVGPRDWVSEGTDIRLRLGRALGAKVLRNFLLIETALIQMDAALAPRPREEIKSRASRTGRKNPTKKR